jgi:hypothetical protein
MTRTWTVRDGNGRLLSEFACDSQLELGRKIVPGYYDPFRLRVSPSYREQFDRAVNKILQRKGWQIVRIRGSQKHSLVTNRFGTKAVETLLIGLPHV